MSRSDLCVFCVSFRVNFQVEDLARRNLLYITTPQFTPEASAHKKLKGHSTHIIDDLSFVKSVINSKKSDILSNIPSYQTLTTDVNSRRNFAHTKLIKIKSGRS